MSGKILQWEDMSQVDRLALKASCEGSFALFLRYFFQLLHGQKFHWNWHHAEFCRIAEEIYEGKRNREIISCPPGSTKTEIWSIHWPPWCVLKNIGAGRSSRWLPISYSDDLVRENAARAKDIIDSEPFQALWPLELSQSTRGKSDWLYTDQNGNKHRLFGTSLRGQVTGRRAGFMIEGFSGALIIDDPLPPRDEGSKNVSKSNDALNKVLRSRLAHNDVPIIMIQQRICNGDSTDFLMGPKSPDIYSLHKIPAVLNKEYIDKQPESTQKLIRRDTGFKDERVSYWPAKEPLSSLFAMERSDPFLFSSQYQQAPDEALLEGVIWRKEIERMIDEGRVCRIPIESRLPTYTFWDLGINDDMSLWVLQTHGLDLRLVAFYKANGEGFEHYINWLKDLRDKYSLRFEAHVAPHDIEVRELGTGKSRKDAARTLGVNFDTVPRVQFKRDSIEATRKLFPRIWIDPERCDVEPLQGGKVRGWEAIKKYRREYDPDKEIFSDKPYHDWTSNPADALQQLGLWWRDPLKSKPQKTKQASSWMGV